RDGWLAGGGQRLEIEHLSAWCAGHYGGAGDWRLDFNQLAFDDGVSAWTAPRVALERNLDEDVGLWISADYLPIDVPVKLARDIMLVYGRPWPSKLPGLAAGGVTGLDLLLDRKWQLRLARGTARQVRIGDWGIWPDLQGLDGTVTLESGFGHLSLHAGRLGVQWPGMFSGPLAFSVPACEIDLTWGTHFQAGVHQCQLLNEDITIGGDALFAGNQGRPAVDVNVEVTRTKLQNLSPYWPDGILSPNLVKWLRQGLTKGDGVRGRFQIRGDMDDWPFRQGEGTFEAVAQVAAGRLDYAAAWPVAEKVDAVVRFSGPSMTVTGTVGDIGGVAVQRVSAGIADLKQPVLLLD
ncbi:MAG: DUF3971 domain-containing protein, partial [Lysobacterales bacterium]